MAALIEFIRAHAARGECGCGKCIDRGDKPDPEGHTADLMFFRVGQQGEPSGADFRRLSREHAGSFGAVDVFDGKEHNYLELGGFIGDQGLALMYMGLGTLLGVFDLLTPNSLMPFLPEGLRMEMAGQGMIAVVAKAQPDGPVTP